jgi:hypothetical protein
MCLPAHAAEADGFRTGGPPIQVVAAAWGDDDEDDENEEASVAPASGPSLKLFEA